MDSEEEVDSNMSNERGKAGIRKSGSLAKKFPRVNLKPSGPQRLGDGLGFRGPQVELQRSDFGFR